MICYIQRIGGTAAAPEVFPAAVIDSPISVRWVRCFDEPGNFELYVPSSAELFTLLNTYIGRLIVTREDSDVPMYVETFKLTESPDEGETILIGGRTMDAVMASRVVGYPTTYMNYPSMVVARRLMIDNMIDPDAAESDYTYDPTARRLSPFAVEPPAAPGDSITRTFGGENLMTAVGGLLREFGRGLKCRLVQGVFTFEFYRGADKPHVVFSADNEMLISCEYEVDIRDKCNVVFVSATGPESETDADGSNPYTLVRQAGNPTTPNYYRREGSMSVSGVPTEESVSVDLTGCTWEQGRYSSTDGETEEADDGAIRCTEYIACDKKIKVSVSVNGYVLLRYYFYSLRSELIYTTGGYVSDSTVTVPNGTAFVRLVCGRRYAGEQISPADLTSATAQVLRSRALRDYKTDVTARGVSGLTPELKILNAQIADRGLYKAGDDYDLGDTVYLETARGVRGSAKITAVTEVEDAEGYRIFPTFSDWTTL